MVLAGVALLGAITACSESTSTSEEVSELSLPGSKFEIDTSSNLVVDSAGNLDWANVTEARKADSATGQNDDSYAGGSKEDDVCPSVGTGSIPNNKSDLKTFGVYHEPGSSIGQPGYLHLYWNRVQDPTGTTLMDFEFNQSTVGCGNGVTKQRTAGDLLLEYRLEQGGTQATIKIRKWEGSAWGAATDLSAVGAATGTINTAPISAADSDGLGAMSARTFGEASIDLNYVFQKDKCTSFGSAMVKSRSSDVFNSALKDFIAPEPISITNCGKVVIRKKTDPVGLTDSFTFNHTLKADPALSSSTFQLSDGGAQEFTNILFGNGYTVTEPSAGAGFKLSNIDCSASSGVTPAIDLASGKVTFDIDADSDVVDCTYTNQKLGKLVIEKVSVESGGTFSFTSSKLAGFDLTTTAAGAAGKASKTFDNLAAGVYDVTEATTAGWHLVGSTCSNGDSPSAVNVAGGTVTCTFTNAKDRGAILITKTRLHAAAGAGWHPHAGVEFAVQDSGGNLVGNVTTDAFGNACIDNLLLGDYAVTENLPAGYVPAGALTKVASVTTAGTCASATPIAFQNLPLTDITV
ncbi:MAG TPA: SpaA isopeptide-forming pilin-related protein, partial [Kofleriaceae bacterium]|nr:SpaA isopeptide-forming pilin-related protein [Kofleriaceae bacterium]